MFGKKQPHLEVIIGPESAVQGELTSKGTVRIDGRFDGNIAAACVIIGDTGLMVGDIAAKGVIVGGKVTGTIRASEGVEMQPRGEVVGDIYAVRIVMAEGARFDGRSYMQKSTEGVRDNSEILQEC